MLRSAVPGAVLRRSAPSLLLQQGVVLPFKAPSSSTVLRVCERCRMGASLPGSEHAQQHYSLSQCSHQMPLSVCTGAVRAYQVLRAQAAVAAKGPATLLTAACLPPAKLAGCWHSGDMMPAAAAKWAGSCANCMGSMMQCEVQ